MTDEQIILSSLGPEPWMRLRARPGRDGASESAEAYAAFELYLHSAPEERHDLTSKPGRHGRQLLLWSSRFHWVLRAAAWDHYRSQIAAAECERRRGAEAEIWEQRRKELRDDKYQTGRTLRQRGEALVSQPTVEKKMQKTDASGQKTLMISKPSHRIGLEMIKAGFQLGDESVFEADPAAETGSVVDVYETVAYEPEGEDRK